MKHDKVKLGDFIWCHLKGADQNYGHGEVINIWEDVTGCVWFDFHCEVNGGLRSGKVENIIEKPDNRMVSKMYASRKAVAETIKNK